MKIFIICIIILILLLIGIIFYLIYSKRKTYNQFLSQYKQKIEKDCAGLVQELERLNKESLVTTEQYVRELRRLQDITKEIEEKQHFNQDLYRIREEELNTIMETKKKAELERVDREIEEWVQSAQEAADFDSAQYQKNLQELNDLKKKELDELSATIDDYKARRDVINQEILRTRAIEEQQDFYRIQLDDSSKEDVEILNNIRQRLNKTNLLNKLIYENYIARPTKEMVKRVLEGKNPSGIYKVTNIKTNEIYIGKSTKISDRFQNHVKSAYGLEGVAESQFQRALKKYGVDNFTWELLEEVSKENLSEAEKRWIVFYGTKNYGYNQREG